MKELCTKAEFNEFINRSAHANKLIVIDFYSDWCGPCRKIKPHFLKLSKKYSDVVFVKVDVDDAEAISEGIEMMPTFVFYKNGQQVHSFSGANEKMLEEKIKAFR